MTPRARVAILACGACLLAAYLAAMFVSPKADGRVVIGDATHYYVQLRSLVFDHDLDFQNEYQRLYGFDAAFAAHWFGSAETSTGLIRNYMPIGPALLWLPLYIVVGLGLTIASAAGVAATPDGFERILQIVPGVSGIAAATAGALVTWRCARRQTDETAATIGLFGIWLGSNALYYTLVSPAYSHAPSIFTSSLFFSNWLDRRAAPSLGRFAVWGALAGGCALMRWQDATFLVVPLIETLRWRAPAGRRMLGAAITVAAFVLVFSPQMFVWNALYGTPVTLPQGSSFMLWTSPHLWLVLFSDNHGLLSWTPIVVPALAGLVAYAMARPALRLPIACVVLTSWYVNAAVADWWAGEAFGARRFLSLFPLFVIGLARWVDRSTMSARAWRLRVAVVAALGALNWLLLFQYQLFMKGLRDIAPYPEGAALWLDRFAVPFRVLARLFD